METAKKTVPTANQVSSILGKLKKSSREIMNIVVHCTAGWLNESTADLIKGFRAQGWKSNGYHIVVNADGTIDQITHLDGIANGVAGNNAKSIHVSYKGGIVKKVGKLVGVDTRTPEQKVTLIAVLTRLKQLHPKAMIKGHRDFSPDTNKNGKIDGWEYIKQCPCFDAVPEYKNIV